MSEERTELESELAKIEQAIAAQEALRDILPDEQIETTLEALRERQASLRAFLWGSGAIVQDHSVAAGTGGVAIGGDVRGPIIIAGGLKVTQVSDDVIAGRDIVEADYLLTPYEIRRILEDNVYFCGIDLGLIPILQTTHSKAFQYNNVSPCQAGESILSWPSQEA